ncbi:MAG: hypothetical protein FWG84_07630 [Bacteroidales bacterium]|nr:hypothetical protein [Bacteroidales bacterium]
MLTDLLDAQNALQQARDQHTGGGNALLHQISAVQTGDGGVKKRSKI